MVALTMLWLTWPRALKRWLYDFHQSYRPDHHWVVLLAFPSQVMISCHYCPEWSQFQSYIDGKHGTLPELCTVAFDVIHLPPVEKQMCGSTSRFDKLLVEAFVVTFHFYRTEGPEQRIFSDAAHGISFSVFFMLYTCFVFRGSWETAEVPVRPPNFFSTLW